MITVARSPSDISEDERSYYERNRDKILARSASEESKAHRRELYRKNKERDRDKINSRQRKNYRKNKRLHVDRARENYVKDPERAAAYLREGR